MILGQTLQHAYVTNDLDRACQVMAQRFGATRFLRPDVMEIPLDSGNTMTLALAHAWVGQTWLEIIQPVAGEVAIYRDWLPPTAGFALRFHHTGVRVDSADHLDRVVAEARSRGFRVVLSLGGASSKIRYIDTAAELGHYIEYLHFPDPANSTMARMPQNIEGFRAVY